jgi:hypothetical protein
LIDYLALRSFFWKKIAATAGEPASGVPCKILKPVAFPADNFDVTELCTPAVKEALALRKKANASSNSNSNSNSNNSSSSSSTPSSSVVAAAPAAAGAAASKAEIPAEEDELAAALRLSLGEAAAATAAAAAGGAAPAAAGAGPSSSSSTSASSNSESLLGAGIGPKFQGSYELFAVVTHKGRDSSSGHYMGWVRKAKASSEWLVFDDDSVSPTDTETVMTRLKGGGDEHMAYLLLYRALD